MIKVLNNSINSMQNLNSFSCNNSEVSISNWFQFILLSLIDNSLLGEKKDLGNLFTSLKENFKRNDDLTNIFIKNNEKTSQKNFLENFDQIKLLLAYLLENGILRESNGENLNDNINSEFFKDFNFINKPDFQNSKIDEEKISLIEKMFSYFLNHINEFNFSNIDKWFDDVEKESFLANSEIVGKNFSKKESFYFKNNFNTMEKNLEKSIKKIYLKLKNDLKDISYFKTETTTLLNSQEKLNFDKISFQMKNFNKDKFTTNVDQLSKNCSQINKKVTSNRFGFLETGNKDHTQEIDVWCNINNKLINNKIDKRKRFFLSNISNNKNIQKESEKNWNRELLILEENGGSEEVLEEKHNLVKNEKELGKNSSLYNIFNNKSEIDYINKIAEINFFKGEWGIDKATKVKEVKTVDFQRLPEDLFEMIKNISFEIQPQGEKKALIKLEPPEMGVLHLEIKTKDKNIEIIARVERPEVLHDIRNNLHHIKSGLEDLGFNLKEFQLFLGSGFDGKAFSKDFKEGYSNKNKIKEPKKIGNNGSIEEKMSVKFYNLNGRYYYIV